ncbi:proteasome subunit beta type-4-like [Histomonas meleagridis]|uniref:proteasome subunit beta type-4-like n=1 Tax=Histomonas meleagridis TaxID=135588 RepID=UPI00355A2800|nr:proteasome subunit beta type-4-like [Histomonas meleagridis]KAH0805469.1 proteasome subunit beta type-4-like [Histomonas meleagridis]
MSQPIQDVQNPITSASSIVGIKYDNGILLASDKAVSYGSCFKFANVSHFHQLTPYLIIGCSGEMADFQELIDSLTSIVRKYECAHNGEDLTPSEVSNYIKRLMYQKRSKLNPLVMRCILAGVNPDGSFYLTSTDLYGSQWEDDYVASGYAAHIQGLQLQNAVKKTREEVYEAIKQIFVGLTARHSVMAGPIEFIDVTTNGIHFEDPVEIQPNWEIIDATWDE